ncbi:MAG: hypothetical protein ACPG77_10550 [Nannocystaceae bacterium]
MSATEAKNEPDQLEVTEEEQLVLNEQLKWVERTFEIIRRSFGTTKIETSAKSFLVDSLIAVQDGSSDPLVRKSFDRFLWSVVQSFSLLKHCELWSRIQVGKEQALGAQDDAVRPSIDRAQRLDALEEKQAGPGVGTGTD